jgi:hydrocephalus-inducing protein
MPIDVSIILKSSSKSTKATGNDSPFEIEPQRSQIMPHSYIYAIVSFTPPAMSSYSTFLEASLENVSNSLKSKTFQFEISGEGNLPRFTIVRPALKNKRGQSLMLFNRCIVNHNDTQQLILSNDGTIPAKVNFFLHDPDSAFKIKPSNLHQDGLVMNDQSISSILIQPATQVSFIVSCFPKFVQPYQASLQLTVTDNQFEDTLIQMIGEGYMEDITIENLHNLNQIDLVTSSDDELVNDEDLVALKSNLISFGDVYINEKKQILFTMKNQNKTDCYKFEWPSNMFSQQGGLNSLNSANNGSSSLTEISQNSNNISPIQFSPRVGHLHAGCAKDITVHFKALEPKQIRKELVTCLLSKIVFEQNINEVKDWDDRITTVKWISENIQNSSSLTGANSTLQNPNINSMNENNSLVNPRLSTEDAIGLTTKVIRKKVIETEAEPRNTKLDENIQPLELYISANSDYCRYRFKTNAIRFKDTLMFQTRVYE